MATVERFGDWAVAQELPRVGLGCWRLCAPGRPNWQTAIETIEAAYGAGTRLYDTADSYGLDESEHGYGEFLVKEALAGRPGVVVVTKGGFARPGGAWEHRGSREWLKRAIEESAKRLGVDTIDCYLLHGPDPGVDLSESLDAICEARELGRIRWVGLSNVSVAQTKQALTAGPIDVIQNRLSVTVRPEESKEMLRFCERERIAFLAYTPFGPTLNEGTLRRVRDCSVVRRIATVRGVSPEVIALAWLLALTPRMFVIPGARRPEAILDSIRALGVELDGEEFGELSRATSDARW